MDRGIVGAKALHETSGLPLDFALLVYGARTDRVRVTRPVIAGLCSFFKVDPAAFVATPKSEAERDSIAARWEDQHAARRDMQHARVRNRP